MLSPDEVSRASRFHFDRDRESFIKAHGALRIILGAYLRVDGATLTFSAGEFGKPRLGADLVPALEFNLSHSGAWALLAVAVRPVGIDIEQWNPRVEFLELARHYFSPSEYALLEARTLEHVEEGFFRIWSRKEAYLKATGCGVALGLHHFDVSDGEHASLLADRRDAHATARWSMREIDVAPNYSAALVSEGAIAAVEIRDFTP